MNRLSIKASRVIGGLFGLMCLGVLSPGHAAVVSSMTVTNGTLSVAGVLNYDLDPGSAGGITIGAYQGVGQIIDTVTVVPLLVTLDGFTSTSGGDPAPSGTVSGTSLRV